MTSCCRPASFRTRTRSATAWEVRARARAARLPGCLDGWMTLPRVQRSRGCRALAAAGQLRLRCPRATIQASPDQQLSYPTLLPPTAPRQLPAAAGQRAQVPAPQQPPRRLHELHAALRGGARGLGYAGAAARAGRPGGWAGQGRAGKMDRQQQRRQPPQRRSSALVRQPCPLGSTPPPHTHHTQPHTHHLQINYFPSRLDPARHAERYPIPSAPLGGRRERGEQRLSRACPGEVVQQWGLGALLVRARHAAAPGGRCRVDTDRMEHHQHPSLLSTPRCRSRDPQGEQLPAAGAALPLLARRPPGPLHRPYLRGAAGRALHAGGCCWAGLGCCAVVGWELRLGAEAAGAAGAAADGPTAGCSQGLMRAAPANCPPAPPRRRSAACGWAC